MKEPNPLPPGQRERPDLPRFGMTHFAHRFPADPAALDFHVAGDLAEPHTACGVGAELRALPRIEQTSDFHCVTTWTCRSLTWSGFRFADFYHAVVLPRARPASEAKFVRLRCRDGYRATLVLDDLLGDDVLLADRLEGRPLDIEHGAPLRLIAPAHYGYKSAKHLRAIEFWCSPQSDGPAHLRFMAHPRARVNLEERGRGIPGWLLRYLYRPLIGPTARHFERALAKHRAR